MKQPRTEPAFTLIELLVVVAIISILAAMLLPVLAQARATAQKATCISNQKQIGTAFTLYAEDYEDFYPPGNWHPASYTWKGVTRSNPWIPWFSAIFLGQYLSSKTICATAYSPYEQMPSTDVLYCPTGRSNFSGFPGNRIWIGYNNRYYNYFSRGNATRPVEPITRAKNPEKLFVTVDVASGYIWERWYYMEPGYGGSTWPEYRHLATANVLFADQHVGSTRDLYADKLNGEVTNRAH